MATGTQLSVLFQEKLESCQAVTAGVLCFSVPPGHQAVYLLLGQEGNGKWCDFGGHIEEGETCIDTAAREFCEESLCVVDLGKGRVLVKGAGIDWPNYQSDVHTLLSQELYFLRLEVAINADQVKVYYLRQVPWQPEVVDRFRDTRAQLLEKFWQQHRYGVGRNRPGEEEEEEDVSGLSDQEQQNVTKQSRLARVRLHDGRDVEDDCEDEEAEDEVTRPLVWPPLSSFYQSSSTARNRFPLANDHPALKAAQPERWLEKVRMEWWSSERLRQVLRNDGKYRHQRFRRSFLPGLEIILNKLHPESHNAMPVSNAFANFASSRRTQR